MSDALEHEVKIIIDIVSNLREATRELDAFNESIGNTTQVDKLSAKFSGAADSLDQLAGAARGAAEATGQVGSGAKGFDTLKQRVEEINELYREHVRLAVSIGDTPLSASAFAGANGLSNTDLNALRRGNSADLLGDQVAETRELEKAHREIAAETERSAERLDAIKRKSLENEFSQIQRTDSEREANAERLDALKRKSLADEFSQIQRTQAEEAKQLDRIASSHAKNAERNRKGDLADREAQWKAAEQAAEKAAQQEKAALGQIAASHERNAQTKRRHAEQDRQAQWQAIQDAKRQAAEEARVTEELKQQAAQRQNATRASAYATPRSGSFLAQGQESGLRAADTTWARDHERRMVSARQALADYDKQLNSNTTSYAANTSALATSALEAQKLEGALPRLRYALYDVSSTATITGAALLGLGVATAGVAISMDRAFADVLRTTETFDVAGKEAQRLRADFEALFTEMPVSWDELTEIGTLAGQLNIARESVADFTELVAKFAATTDVSIEQSATAFGRLSQLLDVPASQFENLGSSILAVGVNSIATESQIIAISTQITSMAATAGFTADEVFGLSAALASLGTQPELSRGVITRLFTNITKAINEGSERLDHFGRLAGESGASFAKSWGDDASDALLRLMQGLGGLEQNKAVSTLNELGITAARDVPTILRLAQNSEVLAESLEVAARGYAEGTALQEQYSIISDTVAEKLRVLANNFQNLVATLGEASGAIGGVVDVAIGLTKALTAMIDNPVAATVLGIVGTVTILGGALLLTSGMAMRGVASMIALRTVMWDLAGATGTATTTLAGMTTAMTGVVASTGAATVAARGLSVAMRAIPIIGTALTVAAVGFSIFEQATMSASEKAEKFFGDLSGFHEALAADTAVWSETGEAITTFTTAVEGAAGAADGSREAALIWLGVQEQVAPAVDSATDAVSRQTVALGANTAAWIKNALSSNEDIKRLANDPGMRQAFEALGGNVDEWIAAGMQGDGALDAYYDTLYSRAQELAQVDPSISSTDAYKDYYELLGILDSVGSSISTLSSVARESANVQDLLGISAGEAGDAFDDQADAIKSALSDIIDAANAAMSLQDSIFGLGQSLAENGDAWDYFSEAGRANMGSLLQVMEQIAAQTPNDAAATASALQGLFDFIVQGSYASAEQLSVLSQAISSLSGGAAVTATAFNPTSFFGGWASGAEKAAKSTRKAGGAARQAAKEIRTLVDYASDLSGVMDRAFDIRFGNSIAFDSITSGWLDIADAADKAREAAEEHARTLAGLTADRSTMQYWLTIAEGYGDELRAAKIRAELADLDADMAKERKELAKAQDEASMSLTGNSKASIENRAAILGMVSNYQDYLEALAASGMSQADLQRESGRLRAEFIRQATQAGYSRGEVEKYAKAFDDMATIINRVPRNITVNANINPALQALAEFDAKARAQAGKKYSGGTISAPRMDTGAAAKAARLLALQGEAAVLNRRLVRGDASPVQWANWLKRIDEIARIIRSGSFASGGYTGDGGKTTPAGIVHRGEFVFSKQATSFYGPDFLNKMHAAGKSGVGMAPVAAGGPSGPVDLSASSINALAGVLSKSLTVVLPGAQLSGSVGSHNIASNRRGGA